ncbi:MAG: APC family permease, partial [Promethearchaeia archaeon]
MEHKPEHENSMEDKRYKMEHKPEPEDSMEDKSYTEKLKKIGLPSVVILGISALTGAGIYSLVGHATEIAGPAVIMSLLIGAIFALIVTSFYSELVSIKPLNGGGYIFIKEAFGQKGLYLGWLTWLANMAYGALVAHTTASFVIILFQIDPVFIQPIAILFIILMAGVNIRGSKFLSKVQIPLTFSLLISLIIGSIYLLINPDPSISWSLNYFFHKGIFSIIPAAALLFVVFIGFEDICTIANETENPRKNIPRAYYIILSITTIVYLIVLISLYFSTSISEIVNSEIAILDAVSQNYIIYFIVLLGAIFSLFATLGVSLMAQSRNLVGLSVNDFVDRKYAKIDEDANAPTKAIKLSAFMTILILLSGQVEFYASITIISFMCVITGLALTIFKYRKTKKYDEETFKVPLHPYSTIIGILMCG